jgi:general L-amino acid transport system substrate-binding protein
MRAESRIRNKIQLVLLMGVILEVGGLPVTAEAQETVNRIKSAGRVVGAVNVRAGLADLPTGASWEGLSVDLTKALAAAVLREADKVSFVRADRKSGPEKLVNGAVNLYLPVEPMAPSRLTDLGLVSSQPFFFNVQKVMVTKDSGVTAVDQLRDRSIAVQPGYVNEQNLEMANEEQSAELFSAVRLAAAGLSFSGVGRDGVGVCLEKGKGNQCRRD